MVSNIRLGFLKVILDVMETLRSLAVTLKELRLGKDPLAWFALRKSFRTLDLNASLFSQFDEINIV